MRRESFKHLECSLARCLDVVGEWWSLLVIRDLFYGMNTFDILCKDLGIARNILANRLKKLAEKGIIEKHSDTTKSRKQFYRLTPKGKALFPIIMALAAWGDMWEAPQGGPPIIFRHKPDGHIVKPEICCTHCGKVINPQDIKPEKSPGVERPSALPMTLR